MRKIRGKASVGMFSGPPHWSATLCTGPWLLSTTPCLSRQTKKLIMSVLSSQVQVTQTQVTATWQSSFFLFELQWPLENKHTRGKWPKRSAFNPANSEDLPHCQRKGSWTEGRKEHRKVLKEKRCKYLLQPAASHREFRSSKLFNNVLIFLASCSVFGDLM